MERYVVVEHKGMDRSHRCCVIGTTFESPSSFSIHVKRLVNPSRKADDGWKTVKHNGQLRLPFSMLMVTMLVQISRILQTGIGQEEMPAGWLFSGPVQQQQQHNIVVILRMQQKLWQVVHVTKGFGYPFDRAVRLGCSFVSG